VSRRGERARRTLDQCSSAAQHDIAEQALPQVEIRSVDRVDDDLVYARVLEADNLGVEEHFRRAMPFRAKLSSSQTPSAIFDEMLKEQ
jgi:hypothetical protein